MIRIPKLTLIEKIIIGWFGMCGIFAVIGLVALALFFLRG